MIVDTQEEFGRSIEACWGKEKLEEAVRHLVKKNDAWLLKLKEVLMEVRGVVCHNSHCVFDYSFKVDRRQYYDTCLSQLIFCSYTYYPAIRAALFVLPNYWFFYSNATNTLPLAVLTTPAVREAQHRFQ